MHILAVKVIDKDGCVALNTSFAHELSIKDEMSNDEYDVINCLNMARFYEGLYRWYTNEQLKTLFTKIHWVKRHEVEALPLLESQFLLAHCSDAANFQKFLLTSDIDTVERNNKEAVEGEADATDSSNIIVIDGHKKIVLVDNLLESQDEDYSWAYVFNLIDDTLEICTKEQFINYSKDNKREKVIKR